jgi:hypothetical protein
LLVVDWGTLILLLGLLIEIGPDGIVIQTLLKKDIIEDR